LALIVVNMLFLTAPIYLLSQIGNMNKAPDERRAGLIDQLAASLATCLEKEE
jgi:hypothetical protein